MLNRRFIKKARKRFDLLSHQPSIGGGEPNVVQNGLQPVSFLESNPALSTNFPTCLISYYFRVKREIPTYAESPYERSYPLYRAQCNGRSSYCPNARIFRLSFQSWTPARYIIWLPPRRRSCHRNA